MPDDRTASQLPDGAPAQDGDIIAVARGGTDYRLTRGDVIAGRAAASHQHVLADVTDAGTAAASAVGDFAAASHAHAASDVTSGTVDTARLGSGSASAATYLRGDQTWAAVSAGALGGPQRGGVHVGTHPGSLGGAGNYVVYPLAVSTWKYSFTYAPVTANRLYLVPFVAPSTDRGIDLFMAEVKSAVALSNFRFGLYANTSTSTILPTGAPIFDSGSLSGASTGVKTYTPGSPILLTAGSIYWTAFVSDAAPSLTQIHGSVFPEAVEDPASIFYITTGSGSFAAYAQAFYLSFTYGSLPTTPVPTGALQAYSPLIFARYV